MNKSYYNKLKKNITLKDCDNCANNGYVNIVDCRKRNIKTKNES